MMLIVNLDLRNAIFFIVFLVLNSFLAIQGKTTAGKPCDLNEFECKPGLCINATLVCDRVDDCGDASDEKNCDELCPEGWFHCLNGECILMRWHCDGEKDCSDRSDELNCGQINTDCASDEFRCHDNTKCLPSGWVCDGTPDCKDHSDEVPTCTRQVPCSGFQCIKSRECVPLRWHCDGSMDCDDASDEVNCTNQTAGHHATCSEGSGPSFYCADRSECLERSLVCNGMKNCLDGSDEGGQCDQHTCNNAGCSHGCFQTPVHTICLCSSGYELSPHDHKNCQDIDECEVRGMCSQKCENTFGSFVCSCADGYVLQEDGRTCKLKDPEPILIYSASRELKMVKLRSGLAYSVHGELGHAVGVDYDNQEDRMYWTEIEDGSEAIKSSLMDGSQTRSVVTTGISVVEDVAFDWIGRNIYFTDSGHQQLVVCDQSGIKCRVILENLRQPRALALYPTESFVFWSDWSHMPAIERAGMDGTDRRALVTDDLGWPNGLAIDYPLKCIYWVDGKKRRVESIKFDGTDRRVVLEDMMLHPFSLAVLEDTFYWTDWLRHTLESCNKFTGSDHKVLLRESSDNIPMGLHAYHPVIQPMINSPCWKNRCTQLCLLSPADGHRCACRQGYELSAIDGVTCHANDTDRVFLSLDDTIYEFQEAVLGRSDLAATVKSKLTIGAITHDSYSQPPRLLYSDMGSKEIVAVDLNSKKSTVLIGGQLDTVQGLAVDWISGNLYWTDSARRTLEVSLNDGQHRKIIVNKFLDHPMDIAILPDKGFLFVAVIGNQARIEEVDLDGTDRHVFIDYEVSSPTSLVIDHTNARLYWVDLGTNKIEWASLDGKHRFAMRSHGGRPVAVSVTTDRVWWSDASHDLLLWMGKETGSSASTFPLNLDNISKSGSTLRLLTIEHDLQKRSDGGCADSNGHCSHLCLSNKLGFICTCPTGMELSSDQRNCQAEGKCNVMEFTCGDGQCVPLDFTCDSIKDCSDGSDEVNCERACTEQEFRCGNKICIPKSWRCDHRKDCDDNSDELGCNKTVACPMGLFACSSGECIHASWKCDGETDCSDTTDELECIITCHPSDFRCKSGQCVPGSWKCDGETDCRDASDEDDTCVAQLKKCKEHEMTCNNGRCVEKDLVCDEDDDCGDGSDERQCPSKDKEASAKNCAADSVQCNSSKKCVPTKSFCDGIQDCPKGEDEKDCKERDCRDAGEFLCHGTRVCIARSWLCDGENDCDDNSDELLPQCHQRRETTVPSVETMRAVTENRSLKIDDVLQIDDVLRKSVVLIRCLRDEFTCESGRQCIALTDLCNHRADCSDSSDEGSFCGTACNVNNGDCSDVCFPTPSGAKCWCRAGFELIDSKTCHDIDECESLGVCSQSCHNVPGTYTCSCAAGYHLRSDHRSCKAEGPLPYLLLAFPTKLLSYTLGGNHVQVIVHDAKQNIKDVTFDAGTGDVYWIDNEEGTLWKYSASTQSRVKVQQHLDSPSVLALDWMTKLLVYSETTGYITVCTLDGMTWSRIFHTKRTNVASLTLDPRRGTIYWSSWSNDTSADKGVIESVLMNGKRPSTIASTKMIWPSGLTIDFIHDVLYWVDVHLQVIESVVLKTRLRQVVSRRHVTYPMSLALFEDRIYWADGGKSAIIDCDLWTCKDRAVLLEHVTNVHRLAVLHPVQQPKGDSPCSGSSKCSHICVAVLDGYACLCPEGMHFVDKLNTTCGGEAAMSRSGKLDRCTARTCLNGGHCWLGHDDHAHCDCLPPYGGRRCENMSGKPVGNKNGTIHYSSVDENGGSGDSYWILWLMLAIVVMVTVILAFWYFRPDKLHHFRKAFAPIPLNNPTFDEDGNPLDEEPSELTTNGDNTYRSYSNPLFETCHGGNLAYNSKDGKVEFHVSASSVSLDSAFVSETPSGRTSRSTLADLQHKDKLIL